MLVVLFAMVVGAAEPVEIAIVKDRGSCDLIASVLNGDPQKPKEFKFGCYERSPKVKA
jgi:hypothetical protein